MKLGKLNFLKLTAKIEVGFLVLAVISALLANSIILWTNAVRVLLETLACVLAFYAVAKNQQASPEIFNYGLGKLENLVALLVSAIILVSFLLLGWTTISRLQNTVIMEGTGFSFFALSLAGSYSLWVYSHLKRLAQIEESPVLASQAVIYLNAALANAVSLTTVLLAFIFREYAWAAYLDPIGSIALGFFLLKSGLTLMKNSLSPLLDGAIEEHNQLIIIQQLVKFYDSYEQLHQIRSRRSGSRLFIEIFLEFDHSLPHGRIIERIDDLKRDLESSIQSAEVWVIPVAGSFRKDSPGNS